jgi:hypothetical protein
MDASDYWITIAELPSFKKSASDVFDRDEIECLIAFLSNQPDAGAIMPRTGGVRKLRWGAKGKGKSTGARILYFFHDLNMPLYLLLCFSKSDRIDISEKEKSMMRNLTRELVEMNWEKKNYNGLIQVPKSA